MPSDHPIFSYKNYCLDFEDKVPQQPSIGGVMVKKVNHNATERDRRKKINSLYSSLRSLLPPPDQTKKLSIPATISRVLKYIPELQAQIQQLSREKERLLSYACDDLQCIGDDTEQRRDDLAGPKVMSTSWLSKSEALIQICEGNHSVNGLSGILLDMEINGLSLVDASSFKSSEGGKVFHVLRVRTVEGSSSSRQVSRGGVFHAESSAFFGSKFSWPTVDPKVQDQVQHKTHMAKTTISYKSIQGNGLQSNHKAQFPESELAAKPSSIRLEDGISWDSLN